MTPSSLFSDTERLELANNRTVSGGGMNACNHGRGSVPDVSNIFAETPLDLSVSVSRDLTDLGVPLSVVTSSQQTSDTSTSRQPSDVEELAVTRMTNILRSTDAVHLATSSISCMSSDVDNSINSRLSWPVVTMSEPIVTVPTASWNHNAVVDIKMSNRDQSLSTAAGTTSGSNVSQESVVSATAEPATVDTSVSQCHSNAVLVREQYSTCSQLSSHSGPLCLPLPNSTPVLTTDELRSIPSAAAPLTYHQLPALMMSKAESSLHETLQPPITSSLHGDIPSLQAGIKRPDVGQAPVASSSCCSALDTVAAYAEQPEMFADELQLSFATPSASDDYCPAFSPSVPTKVDKDDVLCSSHEAAESGVHPFKMEDDGRGLVGQHTFDSAAIIERADDGQLMSTDTEQIGRANSDEAADVSDAVVQSSAAAVGHSEAGAVSIELERTDNNQDNTGHLSLVKLEHQADEADKVISTLTEKRTEQDLYPSKHNICENIADDKQLVNALGVGSEALEVKVTDSAPALAVSIQNSTLSGENVNESEPTSEPGPAAVAMEVSSPVADTADAPAAPAEPDGVVTAAASMETDINERFKDLMLKCTKAMELCLSRFPQHYKSLYRLADVFFRCSSLKVRQLQSRRILSDNI